MTSLTILPCGAHMESRPTTFSITTIFGETFETTLTTCSKSVFLMSLGSLFPDMENPWHGGPAITTSERAIFLKSLSPSFLTSPVMVCTFLWLRLKVSMATSQLSIPTTESNPAISKPLLNPPIPQKMSTTVGFFTQSPPKSILFRYC